MVQIRFQPPEQQRIAFKDRRLLRTRNLHALLRRRDKQFETLNARKRHARDHFNQQQQQQKNGVDERDVK
jgi:hypothetical protein